MADKSVVFVIRKKEEPETKSKLPQTGNAPVPSTDPKRSGGIFGRADPGVKGFQGRKGIRGGVRGYRDDQSNAPIQYEKFVEKINRIEKQSRENKIKARELEKKVKEQTDKFKEGSSLLTNPDGYIGSKILEKIKGKGPYGPATVAGITGIVGIAVSAPEIAAEIIRTLSQKGLPLNDDWKRAIEDEVNALFNIEEKKRRLLGLDAYTVTQTDRYQPESGSSTYNSLENRDEVIISKIGLAEKAVGVQ